MREEWLKGKQQHEDLKYMVMAGETASSSTCAKKQLGCVLVLAKDDIVLSGSNGFPVGMKKCERKIIPLTWKKYTRTGPSGDDLILDDEKHGCIPVEGCPRLESHNGTDLDKCRAVHAELQVIDGVRVGIEFQLSRMCTSALKEGITEVVGASNTIPRG